MGRSSTEYKLICTKHQTARRLLVGYCALGDAVCCPAPALLKTLNNHSKLLLVFTQDVKCHHFWRVIFTAQQWHFHVWDNVIADECIQQMWHLLLNRRASQSLQNLLWYAFASEHSMYIHFTTQGLNFLCTNTAETGLWAEAAVIFLILEIRPSQNETLERWKYFWIRRHLFSYLTFEGFKKYPLTSMWM